MSRKRKKAKDAVPQEILAEGSGPHQDADSLADAASSALAGDPAGAAGAGQPAGDAEVLFEAGTELTDEYSSAVDDDSAAADEVALADSEVGPELEEAEVEAERVAQADEANLEDAVMRAEAEAELGTAEAEPSAESVAEGEEGELGAALPTTAATMDDLQLKHLVEALIFASDKPVTLQRLRQLTRVSDVKRLEAALAALAQDFADRGIALQQVSGGYQFRTNTQFSTWVQQLIAGRPVRLSRAQLETLAIVAYRQPITRPEVDEIRGVDSSATLRLLMDRSLIRILGKKEDVGRPLLYGTTKEFLDFFSLGDLRELPTLREYSELSAESRKVMSDRLGLDADGNVIGAEPRDDADSDLVEGIDMSAMLPEPSLEEMVRDFAQSDVEARESMVDASASGPSFGAMSESVEMRESAQSVHASEAVGDSASEPVEGHTSEPAEAFMDTSEPAEVAATEPAEAAADTSESADTSEPADTIEPAAAAAYPPAEAAAYASAEAGDASEPLELADASEPVAAESSEPIESAVDTSDRAMDADDLPSAPDAIGSESMSADSTLTTDDESPTAETSTAEALDSDDEPPRD